MYINNTTISRKGGRNLCSNITWENAQYSPEGDFIKTCLLQERKEQICIEKNKNHKKKDTEINQCSQVLY